MLTPAALEATKALVQLVLQRERDGDLDAPAGLRQQLDTVPKEALLASIRRHRLECLLHGDPLVASLLPELQTALQVLARQNAMDALANTSGNKSLTSSFVDAPGAGSFSTQGENGGANAFTVAGGFDLQVAKNASLYATVSYEVESNGSQFGYGGGLRVSF